MKNIFLLGLIIQTLTSFGQKTMTNYYNEYTKAHKKEVYQVDNNGYRNGSYKKYFEDGQLAESCTYIKNKVNGVRKLYWELREVNYETGVHTCGGQPLKEEYWINGVESGTWKTWNCGSGGTRKLKEVTKYKKGEVYYELKYHDNGKKYEENNYPNGLYSSWYENGNLEEQYTYVDGYKLGQHTGYYENGQKKFTKNVIEKGMLSSPMIEYYESGVKKGEIINFSDNDEYSQLCNYIFYYEDGTKLSEGNAVIDNKIGMEIKGYLKPKSFSKYNKNGKIIQKYLKQDNGSTNEFYTNGIKMGSETYDSKNNLISSKIKHSNGVPYYTYESTNRLLIQNPNGDTICFKSYVESNNYQTALVYFRFINEECNGCNISGFKTEFPVYMSFEELKKEYSGYTKITSNNRLKLINFDGELIGDISVSMGNGDPNFNSKVVKLKIKGETIYLKEKSMYDYEITDNITYNNIINEENKRKIELETQLKESYTKYANSLGKDNFTKNSIKEYLKEYKILSTVSLSDVKSMESFGHSLITKAEQENNIQIEALKKLNAAEKKEKEERRKYIEKIDQLYKTVFDYFSLKGKSWDAKTLAKKYIMFKEYHNYYVELSKMAKPVSTEKLEKVTKIYMDNKSHLLNEDYPLELQITLFKFKKIKKLLKAASNNEEKINIIIENEKLISKM